MALKKLRNILWNMNFYNFRFTYNESGYAQVHEHLISVNNSFIPPLSEKLNLNEYSNKIVNNADRFEAWDLNKLIGLVAIYRNNFDSRIAFITNVSVDPLYQGYGIASSLLQECINSTKEFEFYKIVL